MSDDRRVLVHAMLARVSYAHRQFAAGDRFLLLAGIAACRAGWLEIAAACRELVLARNPRHLIGRYDSMADALRDADFAPFAQTLDRFCTFEQAENLAERQQLPIPDESIGAEAVRQYAAGEIAAIRQMPAE